MIKSISKASLITLTTVITAIAPFNSQAQSLTDLSVNCTLNSKDNVSSDRETFMARSCIENTVNTIYNPLPSWQPRL